MPDPMKPAALRIGWAEADLTPAQPVAIAGQFHARISEGVKDPITCTALAVEAGGEAVVFVSCDLVVVPDALRDAVRARAAADGLPPEAIVLNATHTHTGPEVRPTDPDSGTTSCGFGVDLPVQPAEAYLDFAVGRIAGAVGAAWRARAPGRLAWGLGQAVVGRNRRWVDADGRSTMYGNTDTPRFSHIEGYEDHAVNVLAAYAADGALTGVVINVPCPAQVEENLFTLSADYWHDTRVELRRRLGPGLRVLAQCSAAGDQSPHLLHERRPHERMWALAGRTQRQAIAAAIADAVTATLPLIAGTAVPEIVLQRRTETLDLPLNALTEEQAAAALAEAAVHAARYEEERAKLESDPDARNGPRWYVPVTRAYRLSKWHGGVAARRQRQAVEPTHRVELHVIRLGDAVVAANPFEYYLDFGVSIKCRSPAVQTFLVQLAGNGTYVPSERSTRGGGYGSMPASNPFGPPAGRLVADRTVELINTLFAAEG